MKLELHTDKGLYKYKFIPIYQGIKRIDKTIAKENLTILKKVCDDSDLPFILFYGTLLGAIREHDFITHDEDIDITPFSDGRKWNLFVESDKKQTYINI